MKVKFIFISVVCMICLGAGILCRDTISHSIFKSGTRMSAWDNMKVQFDLNDLVGQKDDVTASWQDGIKEYRTKKGLKHVYDEYVNVGVFYVSDDFIKTSGSATGHMKLLKSIKSDGSVKEGETISVTYSCNYIPKKDNIYQTSNITPMIRQNECYLLVYDKIVNSDISEKFEQYGCCHKKQLIEIYPIWQSRFKKIPRKSNHNREWSCMTLSFAVPCQHIRINDIKNKRRNRWKRSLKQQRCNRIHTADHQDVRQDIQDRILNKIQYVHSKS